MMGFSSLFLFLQLSCLVVEGILEPEFDLDFPVKNQTVVKGRDAKFTCVVNQLGGFRVAWIRSDNKAIQAIHNHVITHNSRISVSHEGSKVWHLHIHDVQEIDRGPYMCQINTDPMKSMVGYLNVHIPPDILSSGSSGDVTAVEGSDVHLKCKARGYPHPVVRWRREDERPLLVRDRFGGRTKVSEYEGDVLQLHKVSRGDMGAYLCIASNGVLPTISKRVMLHIHFPPVMEVPNQLVGAPLGSTVSLECIVLASPRALHYWTRDQGEDPMVSGRERHEMEERVLPEKYFKVLMRLTVKNLRNEDFGSYECHAKNSFGQSSGNIRIYQIQGRGGSAAVEDRTVVRSRLDDLGLQGQKPKEGNEEEDSSPVHVDLYGLERREIQNSAKSLSLRISFLPLLIHCLSF